MTETKRPRATVHDLITGRAHPDPEGIERAAKLFAPWRAITSPKLFGVENVPTHGPLLFAGNHTVLGIFDLPMMILEVYRAKGLFLRGLGDHIHSKVPVWGETLARLGMVDGTRENCARLLASGQIVLVYPGGAREVAKRRGEAYKLIWKERVGFVRLAIEHGAPIIPFAAVGAEEAWDILMDADDILRTPVGKLLKRAGLRTDAMLPLVKGIGPTPIPRPERLYFAFGEPVEVKSYRGHHDDADACMEVRERVRQSVEDGIAFLLRERDRDPQRSLTARLKAQLKR